MIGIYYLYQNKVLVYIGKSIDVERRLQEHEISFDFSGIVICDTEILDSLERSEIRKHKPILNRRLYKHLNLKKRIFLSISLEPDLLRHLKETSKRKGVTLSRYIRALIVKATGYKEPELI